MEQARQGETIVIAKNGTPLAKLVALDAAPRGRSWFGSMKGQFEVPADFDDPLPDEVLALFEGRDPGASAPSAKPAGPTA